MGIPTVGKTNINYKELPKQLKYDEFGNARKSPHNALVDLRWKLAKIDAQNGKPDGVLTSDEIRKFKHISGLQNRYQRFQKAWKLLKDARKSNNPLLSLAKGKLEYKIMLLASKVTPAPSLSIHSVAKKTLKKLNYGIGLGFTSITLRQSKGGRISEVKKWRFGPIKSCSVITRRNDIVLNVELLDGKRSRIVYDVTTRRSMIASWPIPRGHSDPGTNRAPRRTVARP